MKKSDVGASASGKRATKRGKRSDTTCEQQDKTVISTTDLQRVQFIVPGEPVGQPRHRVSTIGGRGRLYLPKSHPVHAYKAAIRAAFIGAAGRWRTITGPVRLSVYCRFQIPASWSNKKAQQHDTNFHCGKPDADNVLKAIEDELTDCGAWTDDKQVALVFISKRWSHGPSTEITIEEIPWDG